MCEEKVAQAIRDYPDPEDQMFLDSVLADVNTVLFTSFKVHNKLLSVFDTTTDK
jgi:hypothetical protein